MYPADGRKLPDIYTTPAGLRDELQQRLGQFPLFRFWGPAADIVSSRWIGRCALDVFERQRPTLTLVYLPHLDYNLQRLGPDHPRIAQDVAEVDQVCGELIEAAQRAGARVIVLSEYGITAVSKPVHINRALREAGYIQVREELGRELLDAGASRAFAVADHQIAHIYVAEPALVPEVKALVEALPGVERVLDEAGKRQAGLDHPRSGELVAISRADSWFTYYYLLDEARAPDFARTVDIHRKPGYDPVELFLDPQLPLAKARIAWRLAQKILGFRYLMDVISLDATLVKGSHGRPTDRAEDGPLFISSEPELAGGRAGAGDRGQGPDPRPRVRFRRAAARGGRHEPAASCWTAGSSRQLSAESTAWLEKSAAQLQSSGTDSDLYMAVSLVTRKVGQGRPAPERCRSARRERRPQRVGPARLERRPGRARASGAGARERRLRGWRAASISSASPPT